MYLADDHVAATLKSWVQGRLSVGLVCDDGVPTDDGLELVGVHPAPVAHSEGAEENTQPATL